MLLPPPIPTAFIDSHSEFVFSPSMEIEGALEKHISHQRSVGSRY